jgi:hypothetical protein
MNKHIFGRPGAPCRACGLPVVRIGRSTWSQPNHCHDATLRDVITASLRAGVAVTHVAAVRVRR